MTSSPSEPITIESAQSIEARMQEFILNGQGRGPEAVEEVLVFARKIIELRAPKSRYNNMAISKIEEAELLWARGRGMA
jgi:hypothetical protein